jgi:hypothetical protein
MRRAVVVGVVVVAALVAVAVTAVVRRGDAVSATVATVADEKITRKQLDLAVDHFHEQADREGRRFVTSQSRCRVAAHPVDKQAVEPVGELVGVAARLEPGVRPVGSRQYEQRCG